MRRSFRVVVTLLVVSVCLISHASDDANNNLDNVKNERCLTGIDSVSSKKNDDGPGRKEEPLLAFLAFGDLLPLVLSIALLGFDALFSNALVMGNFRTIPTNLLKPN